MLTSPHCVPQTLHRVPPHLVKRPKGAARQALGAPVLPRGRRGGGPGLAAVGSRGGAVEPSLRLVKHQWSFYPMSCSQKITLF